MSTYFRPNKPFNVKLIGEVNNEIASEYADDMPDGAEIAITFRERDTHLFYKDGTYLHFVMDDEGNVIDVFRYGSNDADVILEPIQNTLGVYFFSEYDEEYEELASVETPVFQIQFDIGNPETDEETKH